MIVLSIVFPMYNEEENIDELLSRYLNVLEKYYSNHQSFEIICINDCSSDKSGDILNKWVEKDNRIIIHTFKEHKGHANAIVKGFSLSKSSDFCIVCNADLQYLPEEIPQFLDLMKKNPHFQIVNGWRVKKLESELKKFTSIIYNFLSRRLFKTNLHDHACNFTLYRSQLIKNLNVTKNDQRYFIAKLKYKYNIKNEEIAEIVITHLPRKHGKSKYPVWKKIFFGFTEIIGKKWQFEKQFERID